MFLFCLSSPCVSNVAPVSLDYPFLFDPVVVFNVYLMDAMKSLKMPEV